MKKFQMLVKKFSGKNLGLLGNKMHKLAFFRS